MVEWEHRTYEVPSTKYTGGVVLVCDPTTWEGEAGGSEVQGQLHLHNEFEVSLGPLGFFPGGGSLGAFSLCVNFPFSIPGRCLGSCFFNVTYLEMVLCFFSYEIILVYQFSTTYLGNLMGTTLIGPKV